MHEVMLLNMEISPEPEASKLPKRAQQLAEQAYEALREGDGPRAQELLEQAQVIAPEDPSLVNNLAMALDMQGQSDEAQRMIRGLHDRFPDYFFGIIAAASLEVMDGNLDHAHELLNSLLDRKKMHTTEFTALCRAHIEVWLADDNREAARTWIQMWERVDPIIRI